MKIGEIRSGMEHDRDIKGRFSPGASGNPTGRPPGITDKRVTAKKLLLEPLLPEAIEKLAEAISAGERWAIETTIAYCLSRPKSVDPEELEEFEERLMELEDMARRNR